jgi:hypothetical protein
MEERDMPRREVKSIGAKTETDTALPLAHRGHPSRSDPLDLVAADLVAYAVVELEQVGQLVEGDGLRLLQHTDTLYPK